MHVSINAKFDNLCELGQNCGMKTRTRNISLPEEMDAGIQNRVRSGQYGNASDVVRAGLRALCREEMAARYERFQKVMASLPQDPITPEIEQRIVEQVKKLRIENRKKDAK